MDSILCIPRGTGGFLLNTIDNVSIGIIFICSKLCFRTCWAITQSRAFSKYQHVRPFGNETKMTPPPPPPQRGKYYRYLLESSFWILESHTRCAA